MEMIYRGEKNETTYSRAEKERFDADFDPGRDSQTGSQSPGVKPEQERTSRTNGERGLFFCAGTAIAGGMLDNLIDDYAHQVKVKQREIQKLQDDIVCCSEEVRKLDTRIQELTLLRDEFRQQTQNEL